MPIDLKPILEKIRASGLWRSLRRVDGPTGAEYAIDGKTVLGFCSNDYLGLAADPRVRAGAIRAVEQYGAGSGGSRLISGNLAIHEELEARLAAFKGTQAALLYNSGYHANIGIITALVGPDDHIYSDALNHASLIDGCRLSRATVRVYRHGDVQHLSDLLAADADKPGKKLVVTDSLFSMDGDLAPLPEIVPVAHKYGAEIMVDEAHGTGVFGKNGRGVVDHFNLRWAVGVQMGTLGKSLGSFGAYVAGRRELIDLLVNRSRSFIFTTALPPAAAGAALASLDILEQEPQRIAKLWQLTAAYRAALRKAGHRALGESPIVPLVLGAPEEAVAASQRLFERGYHMQAIRPPTVPEGTSRLRTTVTAAHTEAQVLGAAQAIADVLGAPRHS